MTSRWVKSVFVWRCLDSRLLFLLHEKQPFSTPSSASSCCPLIFISVSEILLGDIPPPINHLLWFLYFRTELGECENLLSDHQCLHLSLCNRFSAGGCKKNNKLQKRSPSKGAKMEITVLMKCDVTLRALSWEDKCGGNLKRFLREIAVYKDSGRTRLMNDFYWVSSDMRFSSLTLEVICLCFSLNIKEN